MKTHSTEKTFIRPFKVTSSLATCIGAIVLALSSVTSRADIPDRRVSSSGPTGYYKVVDSTDPLFPQNTRQEWFLDFGEAISRGQTSGTLAVSVRENPNVRVRILVWQLYPETGTLVIGNQTGEGSRKAVMVASWQLRTHASGLVLERDNYQIALHRAQAED